MEVVRQVLADGAVWRVLDLPEAIRRARDHVARLAVGQVIEIDAQPMRGVLHGHDDPIARAHEEIGRPVWCERARRRVDRARWRVRGAALGYEGEVDRLDADEVLAGPVLLRSVEVIDRQAVDVQGRAPQVGVATYAGRPARPAGRIELHLHEGGARVRGDGAVSRDVRVAVRRARDARVNGI